MSSSRKHRAIDLDRQERDRKRFSSNRYDSGSSIEQKSNRHVNSGQTTVEVKSAVVDKSQRYHCNQYVEPYKSADTRNEDYIGTLQHYYPR